VRLVQVVRRGDPATATSLAAAARGGFLCTHPGFSPDENNSNRWQDVVDWRKRDSSSRSPMSSPPIIGLVCWRSWFLALRLLRRSCTVIN